MRFIVIWLALLFTVDCSTVIFQGLPDDGPPYGKAKGWGHKKVFYYYPDAEVYWIAETNTYAILQGSNWVVMPLRPSYLTRSYYYVILETNESKPWMNHITYKGKYPPGKVKAKGKKK